MDTNTSSIITIGDKQYTLKYDIKALLMLEQFVSTKNITKLFVDLPLSHTDVVSCLYVGLLAEHPSMTQKKAMNLLAEWLKENSVTSLQTIILSALEKAGAVGKTVVDDEIGDKLNENKEPAPGKS